LPDAQRFALAGGAALIARGDIDRLTRDLDFFGPSAVEVDQIIPIVERALRDAGLSVLSGRSWSGEPRSFRRSTVGDFEGATVPLPRLEGL
jgi:hypothetical protein